jgi:hypothetical protein
VDQVGTGVAGGPGSTGGTGNVASFESVSNAELSMFDNGMQHK